MDKKGQVDEGYSEAGNSVHAITLLIFGTIMAISLTYSVSIAISDNLLIDENTEVFFLNEAVRHCFLQEVGGRIYYQTVNPELITNERLEQCIPNSNIAVRITDKSGKIIKEAKSGVGFISGDHIMPYKINIVDSREIHSLLVSVTV